MDSRTEHLDESIESVKKCCFRGIAESRTFHGMNFRFFTRFPSDAVWRRCAWLLSPVTLFSRYERVYPKKTVSSRRKPLFFILVIRYEMLDEGVIFFISLAPVFTGVAHTAIGSRLADAHVAHATCVRGSFDRPG